MVKPSGPYVPRVRSKTLVVNILGGPTAPFRGSRNTPPAAKVKARRPADYWDDPQTPLRPHPLRAQDTTPSPPRTLGRASHDSTEPHVGHAEGRVGSPAEGGVGPREEARSPGRSGELLGGGHGRQGLILQFPGGHPECLHYQVGLADCSLGLLWVAYCMASNMRHCRPRRALDFHQPAGMVPRRAKANCRTRLACPRSRRSMASAGPWSRCESPGP